MKILQIGKFYPIRGGVEKVMFDLTVGLSEQHIQCDMLCASTENHPAETIQLNNFGRVIIVPTKIKAAATMLAPSMITKLRKIAKNYDIIHIHHPDPMAALALFLSGYKGKVVLHWHSDIVKQKRLLQLYRPLQNWLIKRADKIVGTSPVYVQESPFLNHVKNKIGYIPIGITPIVSIPDKVAKIRQRYPNKKIILSQGRLVEYKGYQYLIKAMAQLSDDYHLIIGGKGPLHDDLSILITTLKLQHKVSLIGYVSDDDLPNYFAACDVFCLSSVLKTEAFAIVQLEAMSCHKPLISTEIPGSGVSWVNQHEESGLTIPITDDQAIAAAVNRLFNEEGLYDKLAAGSKKRFESNFTRTIMVDKCLQLYHTI